MSWNVKTPASLEAFLEIAWMAGDLPFVEADRERTARNYANHATSDAVTPTKVISGEAVVEFWRAAGPTLWFAKDVDFDRRFRERFLDLHETAARGELSDWLSTPTGALALVILLDQFPRNAFRGTPRMYETDQMAREIASDAIVAGYDEAIEAEMRLFLYLPFGHSESLPDQLLSVELAKRLGEPNLSHARRHCDIVQRFGRFPHRNPILGRTMRPEEQRYLDEGGYRG